jgi:hypothetical protein
MVSKVAEMNPVDSIREGVLAPPDPASVARVCVRGGGTGSRIGRGSLHKESAMADALATPKVDIDLIDVVDDFNARQKFPKGDLEQLAGTIEETGLVQPIKVGSSGHAIACSASSMSARPRKRRWTLPLPPRSVLTVLACTQSRE